MIVFSSVPEESREPKMTGLRQSPDLRVFAFSLFFTFDERRSGRHASEVAGRFAIV